MRISNILTLFWLILIIFGVPTLLLGQVKAVSPDSSANNVAASDSIDQIAEMVSTDGDIILDEIDIQAEIEKPRVAILPKRLDPELGELEFVDRSFDRELKSFSQEVLIEDDRLFTPNKIENLKKKILKKKRKNNQSDKEKE